NATRTHQLLLSLPTRRSTDLLPVFEPQDDRLVTVTAQDLGPLAGRVTELAQLQELLDSAAAGAGRTLRLLGDAGIGKTRLVRALDRKSTRLNSSHVQISYAVF